MCSLDLYNSSYVENQLNKFRNRHSNHFGNHINLAKDLVAEFGVKPPASLLDIGCSIGTFALEFALDGYSTIGLDFDAKALDAGRKLAQELGCSPRWICADAGDFSLEEKVDIVICFDLFEHLDDNTISRMLLCVRNNLGDNGILVFHTFPTEYNHVFYEHKWSCIPLIPFKSLSPKIFERITAHYSRLLDIYYLLRYAKTHKGYVARTVHPNPLSEKRLKRSIIDAGFEIRCFKKELDSINPLRLGQGVLAKKYFSHQSVAQRSLFGVARKRHEENIELEVAKCDLCGSSKSKPLYSMPDLRFRRYDRDYQAVECVVCGHRFLNPRPTLDSLPYLYPEKYYENRSLSNTRQRERYLKQIAFLPDIKDGRILDVECAGGSWLKIVQQFGWECYGTDFIKSPFCEEGISFKYGTLTHLDYEPSFFDVITAWGAMEHVFNPSEYFAYIHGLLKKNGLFILMVPNGDSLWSRWAYKEDIPRHLHFFRPKTLRLYAQKYDYTIQRIECTNDIYSRPASGRGSIKRRILRKLGVSWKDIIESPRQIHFKLLAKFASLLDYCLIHPKLEEFFGLCGSMVVIFKK